MATVTVTVPDDQAARIAAAVCARDNYKPTSPDDAFAYVQARVFDWLRDITLQHEAQLASQAVYRNDADPLVAATVVQS